MEAITPDTAEAITAWRYWYLDEDDEGVLISPFREDRWSPETAFRALCDAPHTSLRSAPDESCTCGIYGRRAWGNDLQEAVIYAMQSPNWKRRIVIGKVALWGKVIEGRTGYRGELGYPIELHLLPDIYNEAVAAYHRPGWRQDERNRSSADQELIDRLALNYRCPVTTTELIPLEDLVGLGREIAAWWAEHAVAFWLRDRNPLPRHMIISTVRGSGTATVTIVDDPANRPIDPPSEDDTALPGSVVTWLSEQAALSDHLELPYDNRNLRFSLAIGELDDEIVARLSLLPRLAFTRSLLRLFRSVTRRGRA